MHALCRPRGSARPRRGGCGAGNGAALPAAAALPGAGSRGAAVEPELPPRRETRGSGGGMGACAGLKGFSNGVLFSLLPVTICALQSAQRVCTA